MDLSVFTKMIPVLNSLFPYLPLARFPLSVLLGLEVVVEVGHVRLVLFHEFIEFRFAQRFAVNQHFAVEFILLSVQGLLEGDTCT